MNPILKMTHPEPDGYIVFYFMQSKYGMVQIMNVADAVYSVGCFSQMWLFYN